MRLAVLSESEVESRNLSTHRRRAHKLATEPSSSFMFLSSAEDGKVNRFDIRQAEPVFTFTSTLRETNEQIGLNSINMHPLDQHVFAVAGDSLQVLEYDLRKIRAGDYFRSYSPGGLTQEVRSHHHITCLAYSANGSELLATYSGGKILKYDSTPSSPGGDAVLKIYEGLFRLLII